MLLLCYYAGDIVYIIKDFNKVSTVAWKLVIIKLKSMNLHANKPGVNN